MFSLTPAFYHFIRSSGTEQPMGVLISLYYTPTLSLSLLLPFVYLFLSLSISLLRPLSLSALASSFPLLYLVLRLSSLLLSNPLSLSTRYEHIYASRS